MVYHHYFVFRDSIRDAGRHRERMIFISSRTFNLLCVYCYKFEHIHAKMQISIKKSLSVLFNPSRQYQGHRAASSRPSSSHTRSDPWAPQGNDCDDERYAPPDTVELQNEACRIGVTSE